MFHFNLDFVLLKYTASVLSLSQLLSFTLYNWFSSKWIKNIKWHMYYIKRYQYTNIDRSEVKKVKKLIY